MFGQDEIGVTIPGSNRIPQPLGAVFDSRLASGMMGMSMMGQYLQKGDSTGVLDDSVTFIRALKIYEQYTSWTWSYTAGAYNSKFVFSRSFTGLYVISLQRYFKTK
jgi:hypothetical protein